jgi:hypothetical protein
MSGTAGIPAVHGGEDVNSMPFMRIERVRVTGYHPRRVARSQGGDTLLLVCLPSPRTGGHHSGVSP